MSLIRSRRQFLSGFACAIGTGTVAALGLPSTLLAAVGKPAVIVAARIETQPGKATLVLDLTQKVKQSLFKLPNPNRLVIDLSETKLISGLSFAAAQSESIKRVRHAVQGAGKDLRVVIDLNTEVQASSEFVTTPGVQGVQLRLTLRHAAAGVAAPLPQAVKKVDRVDMPAREIIVAIDAGHGGKDPGAVGKNGTREKDIVLKVARRLEALLKKEPGFTPKMIRTGDVYLPLRARIRKARVQKADLFLSIHADASKNKKANGSSVYVLSRNGASSEAARWLADKENSFDLLGGMSLDDKDNTLAGVLLDLSQSHTLQASHTVAEDVLGELKKVGGVHSPRVERAGFAVLKSPDIPSILVETAFISNPSEEKKLRTVAYQNDIAKSLLKGVRAYFHENPPRGTAMAHRKVEVTKYVIKSGDTLSGVAQKYSVSMENIRLTNKLKSNQIRIGQVLSIPANS